MGRSETGEKRGLNFWKMGSGRPVDGRQSVRRTVVLSRAGPKNDSRQAAHGARGRTMVIRNS